MPEVKIKYLNKYSDRHGQERLYYRRKGYPKIPLRGPIGSPEFMEDYTTAHSGQTLTGPDSIYPAANAFKNATMRWLCTEYFKCSDFKNLATSTKIVRRNILDRFCREHGEKSFARLERRNLLKLRDERSEFPESANALIKALRQVFAFGIDYEHCSYNPAKEVPYLIAQGDGFHAWSEDEIEQYRSAHAIGTKARLALDLLLFTGQRRSDVILFGRQHVKKNELYFTQQKNRRRSPVTLVIPIAPALQESLEQSPTGDLTFLVTAFNKPFTSNGFGNRFRKWCNEAGLPHCSAHGLRKAAAALLAEMGCSQHEIMAITGHRSLKEVDRYTKSVRQKKLARSAIQKMANGQNQNKSD